MPNLDCGTLPLEIVQEIIKWNADYTNAVRASSLVSRLWREASLKFLFRDIAFRDKRQLDGWDRWLKGSPQIVQAVRRVQFFPSCLAPQDTLPHLPSMTVMPGVTDLEWCFYSPTRMFPESDLVQFLHNFPSLRSVTLASEFADLGSLKTFLGACGPNVATLELQEGLTCLSKHGGTKKAAQKGSNCSKSPNALDLPKLEHLVIGSERSFFDWVYKDLFTPSVFRQLHSLTIESEAFTLPTLNQIFEACSPTLLQLTIDPTNKTLSNDGISLRPLPEMFSPIQALTKLTIGLFYFGGTWEPENVLDWACAFLEVFQAKNLATLEFLCYAAEPMDVTEVLEDYDWGPLVTLVRKNYKNVQELVLWITMEMDFGRRARASLEQQARASGLSKFVGEGKRLNVKWTVENPSWGSYSDDGFSEDDGEDTNDNSKEEDISDGSPEEGY
ncbi:hypothetical protein Moror_13220 [Moniliophthora roreri MCA 2997]|uniref:F-box domain-containing protein n=2 Tax=Moniliophthora roreri TaxID=221103 RepID=V2WQ08_MONRO|nr:hypothetical protein Moror_13220 [Moniliophthora roreri MCA 2997]